MRHRRRPAGILGCGRQPCTCAPTTHLSLTATGELVDDVDDEALGRLSSRSSGCDRESPMPRLSNSSGRPCSTSAGLSGVRHRSVSRVAVEHSEQAAA